jgi:hypothetical protein
MPELSVPSGSVRPMTGVLSVLFIVLVIRGLLSRWM